MDYTRKILHTAWHPKENIIAVAATNNLFIFKDRGWDDAKSTTTTTTHKKIITTKQKEIHFFSRKSKQPFHSFFFLSFQFLIIFFECSILNRVETLHTQTKITRFCTWSTIGDTRKKTKTCSVKVKQNHHLASTFFYISPSPPYPSTYNCCIMYQSTC